MHLLQIHGRLANFCESVRVNLILLRLPTPIDTDLARLVWFLGWSARPFLFRGTFRLVR